MYSAFFGLDRRPFCNIPDPQCVHFTDGLAAAVSAIERCVDLEQGLAICTAESGLGKTLLLRRLAAQYAATAQIVLIPTAGFPTRRSLLQAILFELKQPYAGLDEQELRLELLAQFRTSRRPMLLLVDEAHLLSERLLEEIRTLCSLGGDQAARLRIVLAGLPELAETILQPELHAFAQRIGCHVTLAPFDQTESQEYVRYRVSAAGGDADSLFTRGALDAVAKAGRGNPRTINQVCDHALLLAFAAERLRIDAGLIEEAVADLEALPLHARPAPPAGAEHAPHEAEADAAAPMRPFPQGERLPAGECDVERVAERAAVADEELEPLYSNPATIEVGSGTPASRSDYRLLGGDLRLPEVDEMNLVPVDGEIEPARTAERGSAGIPRPARTSTEPPATEFEEEWVVDRYARLDSGKSPTHAADPRVTAAPENARSDAPQTPIPVVTRRISVAAVPEGDPVGVFDMIEPMLDSLLGPDPIEFESASTVTAGEEDLVREVNELAAAVRAVVQDPTRTEDRLAEAGRPPAGPLHALLAEPTTPLPPPDAAVSAGKGGGRSRAAAEAGAFARFDTVEPETQDERWVPRPNYKQLFSTLRRRQQSRRP